MRKENTAGKSAVSRKRANRTLTVRLESIWEIGEAATAFWTSRAKYLGKPAATKKRGFAPVFGLKPRSRLALEVGTLSRVVARARFARSLQRL
jgi:hypothetical protein